jgi:hypothetical protein
MKITFHNSQYSHLIAITAAAFVHGAVVAWSMMPSNPIVINQQAIQISFVAPNAADKKNENASHKHLKRSARHTFLL